MKLTRENILWARNLCMQEAKSIRENIAEAQKRGEPFTLWAVVQVENYEAVGKKLDYLLKKKECQEFKVVCCRERGEKV